MYRSFMPDFHYGRGIADEPGTEHFTKEQKESYILSSEYDHMSEYAKLSQNSKLLQTDSNRGRIAPLYDN